MILNDIQIRSGVVGGTLFSNAWNISPHDLLFTAIMAVIGDVVSFFVSSILRKLFSDSDTTGIVIENIKLMVKIIIFATNQFHYLLTNFANIFRYLSFLFFLLFSPTVLYSNRF